MGWWSFAARFPNYRGEEILPEMVTILVGGEDKRKCVVRAAGGDDRGNRQRGAVAG